MIVPVDEGLTVTIELLRVAVMPAGVDGGEKVTVPENPLTLETVKVEVWCDPRLILRLDGLGVMVKSGDRTMNFPTIGPLWMKHQ